MVEPAGLRITIICKPAAVDTSKLLCTARAPASQAFGRLASGRARYPPCRREWPDLFPPLFSRFGCAGWPTKSNAGGCVRPRQNWGSVRRAFRRRAPDEGLKPVGFAVAGYAHPIIGRHEPMQLPDGLRLNLCSTRIGTKYGQGGQQHYRKQNRGRYHGDRGWGLQQPVEE